MAFKTLEFNGLFMVIFITNALKMDNKLQQFYSNGKLLLTSEYTVLKGAKALALPLNSGQSLHVAATNSGNIEWFTYQHDQLVFTAEILTESLKALKTTDKEKANFIIRLLSAINSLRPGILNNNGLKFEATINFNMQWGFGTSSTLINNLAQWANVNAFTLHEMVSKGSGYDIACASANSPIIFKRVNNKPVITPVNWEPFYLNHLNLVYLNKKMPTEKSVKQFLNKPASFSQAIKVTNQITNQLLQHISFEKFVELMEMHEKTIGQLIGIEPIKTRLFSDFNGAVKSLGAWGGDFALTASKIPASEQQQYFKQKGYHTFLALGKTILKSKNLVK